MSFIVAPDCVASRSPEQQPTRMQTARAKDYLQLTDPHTLKHKAYLVLALGLIFI